ncbi:MAG: transposase [Saprospiraceae bacterium]
MSTKYKFLDAEGIYFVSFATVGWVDVFTRIAYKEIFVGGLRYCINKKGLFLYAWCLMTNHVHLIFSNKESGKHSAILRDIKKLHLLSCYKKLIPIQKKVERKDAKDYCRRRRE